MQEIQAELKIRRRLENIFNKTRDEFESKKAYDDYLEMREEYIFNLALNIDVVDTEGKIAEYQRLNHENIIMNRARQMAANRQTGDTLIELPSTGEAGAAEAASKALGGTNAVYVPAASQAGASLMTSLPVPMHSDFVEDKDGIIRLSESQRQKKHWRQIAAASGWNPSSGLKKTLIETMKSII